MTGLDAQLMSQGVERHQGDTLPRGPTHFVAAAGMDKQPQALYHGGGYSKYFGFSSGINSDPKTRRARLRIGTLRWAETVARQAAGSVQQTFLPLGSQ